MKVRTIVTGPFQENAYLIWEEGRESALFIDPGDEPERLIEAIDEESLRLGAILVTHAHLDHVGAVAELQAWSGATVAFPDGEKESLAWLPESYQYFGMAVRPIPKVDRWFSKELTELDGELPTEVLGGLGIAVLATPGHTPGGTSYRIGDHCFVGDTLFRDSVGRTDLPGGDWTVLQSSLRRLMRLPEETVIYPGHGETTTIGRELRSNPFINELRAQDAIRA